VSPHDLIGSITSIVGAAAAVGIFAEARRVLRTIERHDVKIEVLWREHHGNDPTPPPSYSKS